MSEKLLPGITSPDQLKDLTLVELEGLAQEVRDRIIEVLAVNGGHLASNLGTVELTIAMHKAFNSPDDKFIWDVAHQVYTHKILTGRNEQFSAIRKYKGLCGFSHPDESEHDHFHAGHAGTALSLGLGVARNRELSQRSEYIMPVIGDATLTCGVTLEALNNIPPELRRFIVILNDNAMSISKNVGAMTRILSRMLSNPTTHKLYQEMEGILNKIPAVGDQLVKHGQRIKESVKNLVSPAAYFEQFNLSYIGPIDGHDIKALVETFEGVKNSTKPVLIHVLTTKGKGLPEAVKNPTTHHGAKPFDRCTGKFLPTPTTKPTFPKLFGKHLVKMATNDPSLVAVTPAMAFGSCLVEFMEKFPERCLDVGIAESHAVTFAGGIAYGKKMKVVMSIYGTFLQRALDNLFLDTCLQELPVVFAIDRAGLSAADGATHHGIYDISFLKAMPNMVITQPRNGHVLKELLESAFSWGRPTAIRYPNLVTEDSEAPIVERRMGQGEVLAEGKDILLIGLGHMCETAMKVREQLKEYGVTATVLDPVFVKPLDSDLLCRLLCTHQRVVTIEEHSLMGGLGNSINHFLMTHDFSGVQMVNFGIPDTFVEFGGHGDLLNDLGLTPEKITRSLVQRFSLESPMESPSVVTL